MRLFFIILCFCFIRTFAQAPAGINMYLKSIAIPQTAKDLYNGHIKASDNTTTLSIVDSLQTANNFTRPFYILVISKLLQQSDGVLSEAAGLACKNFFEAKPQLLIECLYSNNTIVDKKFKQQWANIIRGEFEIDCENKVQACIASSQKMTQPKCNNASQANLADFYNLIKKGL